MTAILEVIKLREDLEEARGENRNLRAALQDIADTREETIRVAAASWLRQCMVIAERALDKKEKVA